MPRKFEDAIFYYEKALKNKNSNNLNILYQIGLCYKGLEQNNNSAKYFKRTLIKQSIVKAEYALIAFLAVYALLKSLTQRFKKQGT